MLRQIEVMKNKMDSLKIELDNLNKEYYDNGYREYLEDKEKHVFKLNWINC